MAQAPEKRASGVTPWVFFDFLNSWIIINGSVHFSAWFSGTQGLDARWYGVAYVASGLVLLAGLPVLGAVIDRRRCGRQVLLGTSLGMVACAVAITSIGHWGDGAWRAVAALATFATMNTVYQASLVAYNWLLVYLRGVRTEDDVRRTSGYGEAAGMAGSVVGSVAGIGLLQWLGQHGSSDPRIDMFATLGVAFLVAGAVCWFFLRRGLEDDRAPIVRLRYRRVWVEWVRVLRDEGSLRRFFLAFLLFANAVLTVLLYLSIYMQDVLGYGPEYSALVIALALIAATGGGLLYAKIGSKHDTRRAILGTLVVLAPAMAALAWARQGAAFLAILLVMGGLYGALWSACRAHLIELSHRAKLGRALAFFAVFERSASVVGPLLWAGVMFWPGSEAVRYSLAITSMAGMVVVGALVMWRDIRVAEKPKRVRRRRQRRPAAAQAA